MKKSIQTLCMIHKGDKILLGYKKRGFGVDHWNGFGGKVEKGESIAQAAIRELEEEIGVKATKLTKKAILTFRSQSFPETVEMHTFEVTDFTGTPTETEEMRPQWFDIKKIPYDKMWADDRHWLPLFLKGKKLIGEFYMQDPGNLIKYELRQVRNLTL